MGCHVSKEGKEVISERQAQVENAVDDSAKNTAPNECNHDSGGAKNAATDVDVKKIIENVEEVDIDLNDPEVKKAATKIQSTFRGHMARKEAGKSKESPSHGDDAAKTTEANNASEEISADILELDPNDKEVLSAVTKIQAGFRGHMARKDKKKGDSPSDDAQVDQKLDGEEEEEPIDLTDPDLEKAATKIQATFRGHRVRSTKPDA